MINQFFSDNSLNFMILTLLIALALSYLISSKLLEKVDLLMILLLTAIIIIFILSVSGYYNHTLFGLAILIIVFVIFLKLNQSRSGSDSNVWFISQIFR